MTLKSWEYRDPAEVIATIAERRRLRDGDMLLVLVRDPSGEQAVVRLRSIPRTRRRDLDDDDRARLLADQAERLRVPRRRGATAPWHSIMTITVRRGYVVFGAEEGAWGRAWLYSNHGTDAFSMEHIVVTEHGWADWSTGWGGREPRLGTAGQA